MKKIMAIFLVGAAIGLVILTADFYLHKNTYDTSSSPMTMNASQNNNSEAMDTIVTKADFLKYYNSLEDLVTDADLIIQGKVLETNSFIYLPENTELPTVMTKVKVLITQSFNNHAKKGDIVTFIEAGGIATKKELGLDKKLNLPKEQWNDKVKVISCGVPVMEKNETVMLFGSYPKSSFKVVNEPHYYIIGLFQGKFHIKDGYTERIVPETMKNENYSNLKMKNDEIELKTKELVDKKIKQQ